MKTMLAIPVLCLAMNAAADCPVKRPQEQPVLPDAAVASAAEMHQARLDAEKYLLQGNAYLDCGLMNSRQHSQFLTQLEMFSEKYSEEVIEYQVRTSMIADK